MTNRLERAVRPEERIDFLVRTLTPGFRQSAWIEKADDGSLQVHMALIRNEEMTLRRGPHNEMGTLRISSMASNMVIPEIPESTPREKLVSLATGHLSDMLERALAHMKEAAETHEIVPPTQADRPGFQAPMFG